MQVSVYAGFLVRELAREVRDSDPEFAKEIKGMRWPTLYAFGSIPEKHFDSLSALRPEAPLGCAYLLKEQLLEVLRDQQSRISQNPRPGPTGPPAAG